MEWMGEGRMDGSTGSAHTPSLPSLNYRTWYSIDGSYRLLRQMAHVSVQMAHDHMATAFHFFTSNRGPAAEDPLALALPFASAGAVEPASTSMASPMCVLVAVGGREREGRQFV